jgi:hypothetical protein
MINQMNPINKMCDKCLQEFASDSDTIKYKCGHIFHRSCLLPQKLSILNPTCKKCENGMIDGYPTSDEDEDDDDDDDDANLTKIETIVVVQISVLVVSLIGLLIGLM